MCCDTFPVRDMKSPVVVDKPPEYHGKTDNNIKEVSSLCELISFIKYYLVNVNGKNVKVLPLNNINF